MISLKPIAQFICSLFLCLLRLTAFTQDKSAVFGKISPSDFSLPASLIDSNTNAVLLSDIGNVSFKGNDRAWFSHIYKRQIRIKILNKKAFDLATERIYLWAAANYPDKIDKIEGATYNLEDGKVVSTPLA